MRTTFSQKDLIWHCTYFPTQHVVQKNGKQIIFNKRMNRPMIVSNNVVQKETLKFCDWLTGHRPDFPIEHDIWLMMWFTFPVADFYTKVGKRKLTLPDLSNLYEWPQDCLQKAGIIKNDTQVCSHDWSRRFVGDETKLEIFIMRFLERPNPS